MYFINPQLSGPIAQSLVSGMELEYANYNKYVNYLYNASIPTVSDSDLANLGILIGCPWPLINNPDAVGISSLVFSDSALFPENGHVDGFSDISMTYGGLFETSGSGYATAIPRPYYETIIKQFALIKNSGLTITTLDSFCFALTSGYTFSWSGSDIYVTLSSFTDSYTLAIAQYAMGLLTTSPQIFFTYSGISNNFLFFDTDTFPTIDNLEGYSDLSYTLGGFLG